MGEFHTFGMTPHKIYEYFATGRGTQELDDAQVATRAEWDLEEHRAGLVRRQAELVRGGWRGTASEGAFGAAQPLAESASHGADLLSRSEDLLARQSGSFHRTKNAVKPVPPEPPRMDPADLLLPFSDYEKEITAYQADAQHNIDVYRGYDGASEYNQKNMPREYATVNHAGGDISVTAGDDRRGDTTGDYVDVPDHVPPRGGDESTPSGQRRDPDGVPASGPPVSGPLPGPQQPRQTSPSDVTPPPVDSQGFRPPSVPRPTPGGPTPGGPGTGLPVGGLTGTGPGVLGGAPVTAGRGHGDQDTEHQRKVLTEIDAEGTFGSDVLTAPEVIGDDEHEDD